MGGVQILEVQTGFQEKVYNCKADIAIIGGAMGAGKSYALLLEVMKHIHDPHFRCGIFRKQRANILCTGGLWEELLYLCDLCRINVKTNRHDLKITFPSGAIVQFGHARENIDALKRYLKGTQYTCVHLDEGDEFPYEGFRFLLARMRSRANVKPYMRITTNPSEGWIKTMIKPFLKEDDYPITEECGKVKYLYFINNDPIVRDTKEEFVKEFNISSEDLQYLKTFTFIAGRVDENKRLLEHNPDYLANLKQMSDSERDRFLYGWWGELPKDGLFTERDFHIYTGMPDKIDEAFVVGDTAMKAGERNDFTVFTCWATSGSNLYLIDMARGKWEYQSMRSRLKDFLEDYPYVTVCYLEDCGTGTVLLKDLANEMRDVRFRPVPRASRLASKAKRAQEAKSFLNNIKVYLPFESERLRTKFLKEICAFSLDMSHAYDDIADTFFDAACTLGLAVRKRPKNKKLEKPLSQTIENVGSNSLVYR